MVSDLRGTKVHFTALIKLVIKNKKQDPDSWLSWINPTRTRPDWFAHAKAEE